MSFSRKILKYSGLIDSRKLLLGKVREIDPAVLCRFYRDNKIAMDILLRLVYSTVLTTLFFTTIAVTTTITAVRLRRVVQWHLSSTSSAYGSVTTDAGGDVGSVHSLPGPDHHGSDRFVRGARVLLHWPLLQPRLRYDERHDVFPWLQLFLQLLHQLC